MRKLLSCVLALMFLALPGCSSVKEETSALGYYEYLGQIDYSSSVSAFVWEQVEGEDDGFYGIQYRAVTDFNGITSQDEIAVCLYFYTTVVSGTESLTAGVEDLAQTLAGRVMFIAIDAMSESSICSAYSVEGYPAFILIDKGARVSTFNGYEYESWTVKDVADWLTDNGFEPDLTMLEA